MSNNLADRGIMNAIDMVKATKTKLANILSRYDQFYFDISQENMENIASLVSFLKLYAIEDDSEPVAIVYMEDGQSLTLVVSIAQKQLGTANHALIKHRIAEFAVSSNAVFKTARKAKICCNCVYRHKEPHCLYAEKATMYYSCDKWEL